MYLERISLFSFFAAGQDQTHGLNLGIFLLELFYMFRIVSLIHLISSFSPFPYDPFPFFYLPELEVSMHTSLIEACIRYLTENPMLKNEVYTPEQAADLFLKSGNREELLIYGRAKIVRAFETCKKRK